MSQGNNPPGNQNFIRAYSVNPAAIDAFEQKLIEDKEANKRVSDWVMLRPSNYHNMSY